MPPQRNNNGVKLPNWAKLIQPKKDPTQLIACCPPLSSKAKEKEKHALMLQEEEVYMRKRCFHILSHQMQEAMEQVQRDALAPCLAAIVDCLDAASPSPELRSFDESNKEQSSPQATSHRKRQRLFSSTSSSSSPSLSPSTTTTTTTTKHVLLGLNSQLFDQRQQINTPHDPLLLPVIVLEEGPSFGLDRKDQRNQLLKMLRASRKQSAVVMVERSTTAFYSSTTFTTSSTIRQSQSQQQQQQQAQAPRSQRSSTTTTTSSSSSSSFHWMHELVRQCHQQFPILSKNEALRRRIVERKKKRACTFSDMLLLWAQYVSQYDEIVIFLDADDSFYSPDLQDFLHVLAARRAEQGIPLSVVMLGPHDGRRPMELKPSLQGYAGFRVRSTQLPSSDHILDKFWKKLWIDEQQFPILFPSTVLAAMGHSHWYHQASVNRTLCKFQQLLACYFSQRGSFLSVTSNQAILSELWQRIAWFLVEEEARGVPLGETDKAISSARMLKALDELETRQQKSHFVLQLVDSVHTNNKHQTRQQRPTLFHPMCSFSLQHMTRKEMLEQLLLWKKQISNSISDFDSLDGTKLKPTKKALLAKYVECGTLEQACTDSIVSQKQQLAEKQKILNELIVLVANCRDGDDLSEIEQHLDETLARWIFHRADRDFEFGVEEEELSFFTKFQWEWSSHPPEYDWTSMIASLSPEPRSETLAALLRGPRDLPTDTRGTSSSNDYLSLATVAGTMYRLIQDRVAATQEDWYEEFWQKAILPQDDECSREKSYVLFSLGLRYLKQCGFISEKLQIGSKSDIIYERAKLVWCGG